MRRTTGVESWNAVWTPTDACVAPGPLVTSAIPGRPVSLPYASAMLAAPASWRQTMRRTFSRSSYSPSRSARWLSPGTQKTWSAPWTTRLRARISPPVPETVDMGLLYRGGDSRAGACAGSGSVVLAPVLVVRVVPVLAPALVQHCHQH